jgi:hypothetical protein
MTNRLFQLSLLGLVIIAGVGAYTVRRNPGSGQGQSLDCTRDWLCLSGSQCDKIRRDDPNYQDETELMTQALESQQQGLVELIANPDTSVDVIRTKAQGVMDAHHALMRRVVDHLLTVRRHADAQQCMRLNQLWSGVMGVSNTMGGHGQGRGRPLNGRGGPHGQGLGMGRGQGRRQGQLAPALALTLAQKERAAQFDPNYDSDATRLTQQTRDAHLALALSLTDPNTSESSVVQVLENYITIHTELEQRTIEYVLSIRPMLSSEQQQRLIGLSQRGRRWRGGRNNDAGPLQ